MKAALKNIKNFLRNVFQMDIYSFKVLKLMWTFKHIPVIIDPTKNPGYAALISRDIGFKKGTKTPVKLKVPIPMAIVFSGAIKKENRLSIYLHELGHYLDVENMKKLPLSTLEIRAWEKAFELSRQYNIPIKPELVKQSLTSYGISKSSIKESELNKHILLEDDDAEIIKRAKYNMSFLGKS